MKDKKKKKGGQRAGAGRKPSGRQKEAVTVYTDVSRFGGKEGARMAIYEFLNGQISPTGKSSFVPLEWPKESHEKAKKSIISDLVDPEKKFSPSDRQIKQKAPKEIKRPVVHLNKPIASLESQERPKKTIAHSTTFDSKGRIVEDLKIQQAPVNNFEAAISETAEKAIREQIDAIRAEKIPKERDTPIGRRSWAVDQHKRIQELQNKLK